MRVIDADALIAYIRKNSASYFADNFAPDWVDRQPTIEPKRGEWIDLNHNNFYKCSVCGGCGIGISSYNFCPNCGARMKGADDEAD